MKEEGGGSDFGPVMFDLCDAALWLSPPERTGETQRAAENERDDRISGEIMPAIDGRNLAGRGDPHQEDGAEKIGDERDRYRARQQNETPRHLQPCQLAEDQADHERRLERTYAAAGFVYSHDSGRDPDQIALNLRRYSEQRDRFRRQRRDGSHQALDDRLLDGADPRNGDET